MERGIDCGPCVVPDAPVLAVPPTAASGAGGAGRGERNGLR